LWLFALIVELGILPNGFPFIPKVDNQNNLFLNLPVRLRKDVTTFIP
jgi:hypothetical protein